MTKARERAVSIVLTIAEADSGVEAVDAVEREILAAERAAADKMRKRCAQVAEIPDSDEDLDDYQWGAMDGRNEAARLILALEVDDA